MFKYLLAVCLLTATVTSNEFFLTPPFLPTAFAEQYYEVRHRVRYMPHAEFTYTNLPPFLTGSSSGVISGTPDITGTFKFSVAFTDGENSGEEEIFLSVTNSPNTIRSDKQNKEVVELIVTTALNSWIYRVNDRISFELASKGGKAPIVWSYRNLPKGLYGDSKGRVRGTVKDAGLYSFSATCGDSMGQKASSYYTLNVQPGSLIKCKYYLIQPTTSLMSPIETLESSMTLTKLRPNKLQLTKPSSMLWLLLLPRRLSPRPSKPPKERPILPLTLPLNKKLLLRDQS